MENKPHYTSESVKEVRRKDRNKGIAIALPFVPLFLGIIIFFATGQGPDKSTFVQYLLAGLVTAAALAVGEFYSHQVQGLPRSYTLLFMGVLSLILTVGGGILAG